MKGSRVLIVDDEEDFAATLAERLETRGLRVDVVHSGDAALGKAKGVHYDAIVLDLAMPGLDGIETLKRLIADNPDLQVILLTGQATVKKSIEAMKHGAMDLMEKPAKLPELLDKIQAAATHKMELVEKRSEDAIAEILRKKGW